MTITGGSFFVGTSLPYTFASLELDLKETYVSIVSMLYLLLDVRTASIDFFVINGTGTLTARGFDCEEKQNMHSRKTK